MNKKLLSLAVAAGLASSSAMAVDLNSATPASTSYATESSIGAAGTSVYAAVAANNVTVNAGFSISDGTERYMRFDITGATFGTDVTALALAVADSGGGASVSQSSGGAAKDAYVIYEVTASAGNTVGSTDDAVLTMSELTVTSIGTIGVTYRLYSDALDAVNNVAANALVSSAGNIATGAAGGSVGNTTAAGGAFAASKIDVGAGAAKFVDDEDMATGLSTVVNSAGSITVTDTAGSQMALNGTTDVISTVSTASATLVVTGDFTATQDLTASAPDGTYTAGSVFLGRAGDKCLTDSMSASTLTEDTATFAAFGNAAGTSDICMTVNGVSTIAAGSYSAVYTPTANTGYTLAATTLTTGSLGKNGSTTILNLALSPTGAYPSFIRVNNTSNIAGAVTITLINDDGASEAFELGDVSGQTSSVLAGQASTSLLNVADLMAAAQAADATFDVGANSSKLRVSISGEFSTIAAQSITTSIDGNSFTTF